jgi:DNA-binding PadR family transcriptional regulator
MFGNRIYTTTESDHPGHHPGHHGGHRHRHGPRGGGFGGGPFGSFGPGGPRGRGRKARRGDIRTAALLLLNEEPRNGYQIMQEVEERSDGVWRPSPGSTYPALQQLEDEGLIRAQELDGRKLFQLTDAGREYVKQRGEDKPAPWERRCLRPGARAGQVDSRGRLRLHAGGEDRQRGADGRGSQGAHDDEERPVQDPRRR